jgi:hypothetical protein
MASNGTGPPDAMMPPLTRAGTHLPGTELHRNTPLTLLAAALLLSACQERLAAPADCPNLCPGGYKTFDTTLVAIQDGDSAFQGYVRPGQGSSLLVSYTFPLSETRALYRFARRTDSLLVGDSLKPYTIDSVALALTLGYRDTTVKGLKLYLYRLPATVDSNTTFAEVDAAFTPASIIDSFTVDDSVRVNHRYRTVLAGADLAKVVIPPADSGVLALGVQIRANSGTAVRIGGAAAGSSGPSFISYVRVPTADTSTSRRQVSPGLQFNNYVTQSSPAFDLNVLTVGGAPSARSLIRFPWPAFLKDSATLVRATLEIFPTGPIEGLNGDTAFVQARPVLADFGGKSPTSSDAAFTTSLVVVPGPLDTLAFEVRRALTLWQGVDALPPALMLLLFPEASSFTRPTFNSTRSSQPPRLVITYTLKFPFAEP